MGRPAQVEGLVFGKVVGACSTVIRRKAWEQAFGLAVRKPVLHIRVPGFESHLQLRTPVPANANAGKW